MAQFVANAVFRSEGPARFVGRVGLGLDVNSLDRTGPDLSDQTVTQGLLLGGIGAELTVGDTLRLSAEVSGTRALSITGLLSVGVGWNP